MAVTSNWSFRLHRNYRGSGLRNVFDGIQGAVYIDIYKEELIKFSGWYGQQRRQKEEPRKTTSRLLTWVVNIKPQVAQNLLQQWLWCFCAFN